MKKYWMSIALLVCLVLGSSACAKTNTPTPGIFPSPTSGVQATPSLPTPTPVEQETPSPSPGLPDPGLLEGEYVLTKSIVVGGGRKLTVKLYGNKLPDVEMYGIRAIDVLDGDARLHALLIPDDIIHELEGSRDAGFTAQDMNFDGSEDIGLVGWTTAMENVPHYYWFWNEAEQRFLYVFCLLNPEVDLENQQLISRMRSNEYQYDTEYYRYDEDGWLQTVKRVIEIVDEDGGVTTETYELIDGELRWVE